MPRTAQPRAGSTTIRSPAAKPELSSTTSPRISCPRTKGGEVRGEKYGEVSADSVPRSEPQMPERSGPTRTHSGVGSFGSGKFVRCSGEKERVSRPFTHLAQPPAGVNGDGNPDRLQHRQVGDGVCVRVGTREVEFTAPRERGEHPGARLSRYRRPRELASVHAILFLQTRREHVVGQVLERLQDEVQGAREQHDTVPCLLVLPQGLQRL